MSFLRRSIKQMSLLRATLTNPSHLHGNGSIPTSSRMLSALPAPALVTTHTESTPQRKPSFQRRRRQSRTSASQEKINDSPSVTPAFSPLILEDSHHPVRNEAISKAAWSVLLKLRASGHETYLVGGTVRDILLNRTPKDQVGQILNGS